jgi:hypothetical protein
VHESTTRLGSVRKPSEPLKRGARRAAPNTLTLLPPKHVQVGSASRLSHPRKPPQIVSSRANRHGFQAWLLGLKPMGFGFRPPTVKPPWGTSLHVARPIWRRRPIHIFHFVPLPPRGLGQSCRATFQKFPFECQRNHVLFVSTPPKLTNVRKFLPKSSEHTDSRFNGFSGASALPACPGAHL